MGSTFNLNTSCHASLRTDSTCNLNTSCHASFRAGGTCNLNTSCTSVGVASLRACGTLNLNTSCHASLRAGSTYNLNTSCHASHRAGGTFNLNTSCHASHRAGGTFNLNTSCHASHRAGGTLNLNTSCHASLRAGGTLNLNTSCHASLRTGSTCNLNTSCHASLRAGGTCCPNVSSPSQAGRYSLKTPAVTLLLSGRAVRAPQALSGRRWPRGGRRHASLSRRVISGRAGGSLSGRRLDLPPAHTRSHSVPSCRRMAAIRCRWLTAMSPAVRVSAFLFKRRGRGWGVRLGVERGREGEGGGGMCVHREAERGKAVCVYIIRHWYTEQSLVLDFCFM